MSLRTRAISFSSLAGTLNGSSTNICSMKLFFSCNRQSMDSTFFKKLLFSEAIEDRISGDTVSVWVGFEGLQIFWNSFPEIWCPSFPVQEVLGSWFRGCAEFGNRWMHGTLSCWVSVLTDIWIPWGAFKTIIPLGLHSQKTESTHRGMGVL